MCFHSSSNFPPKKSVPPVLMSSSLSQLTGHTASLLHVNYFILTRAERSTRLISSSLTFLPQETLEPPASPGLYNSTLALSISLLTFSLCCFLFLWGSLTSCPLFYFPLASSKAYTFIGINLFPKYVVFELKSKCQCSLETLLGFPLVSHSQAVKTNSCPYMDFFFCPCIPTVTWIALSLKHESL